MDLEAVMKKFDQESNVRVWEGKPRIAVNCVLAAFSLFCLYVTLFASWLEELRLTTFVAWIVFLGFLVFPAKKSHQKVNHVPWYDILAMVLGTGAFLYFSFNAVTIIQQGTRFAPYQIVIGIVGILALAEVCRRSVGLPILIVAGCFLAYALIAQLHRPLPVLQQGGHSLHPRQRVLQIHCGLHHFRRVSGAYRHRGLLY